MLAAEAALVETLPLWPADTLQEVLELLRDPSKAPPPGSLSPRLYLKLWAGHPVTA